MAVRRWASAPKAAAASAALLAALAGCATPTPTGPPASGPPAAAAQPASRATLADARRYAAETARLFPVGMELDGAVANLQARGYRCLRSRHTLGEPPSRVCRRTATDDRCRAEWQVFFYGAPTLTRARGVYDRACEPDPLLGGPG